MPAVSFDYAIIRVVPRVERQEFINVGVLIYCRPQRFLQAGIEVDERLRAFAPTLDFELLEAYLQTIPQVCAAAGPLGQLPQQERFHWLVAPRSTIIQFSPVHTGLCENPQAELERLMEAMVRQVNR
ncbi:MAG: DUF3037 domain-containing protein [Candidatus Sericytochromatia bacterium]